MLDCRWLDSHNIMWLAIRNSWLQKAQTPGMFNMFSGETELPYHPITSTTLSPVDIRVHSTIYRPQQVHAGQGHKVGLHTPTIIGGNSHLNWFYDRGAIKDPAHAGTSKRVSQAINRGPMKIPAKLCRCLRNHSEPCSQCRCTVPLCNRTDSTIYRLDILEAQRKIDQSPIFYIYTDHITLQSLDWLKFQTNCFPLDLNSSRPFRAPFLLVHIGVTLANVLILVSSYVQTHVQLTILIHRLSSYNYLYFMIM